MSAQMWNEEDAGDEVLAMVARTGLRTTVGSLLQQVMTSVHATPPRMDTFIAVSLLVTTLRFNSSQVCSTVQRLMMLFNIGRRDLRQDAQLHPQAVHAQGLRVQ